jgi:hypothetical protein
MEESFVSHSLGRAAFLAAAHGTRHSLGRAAFFAAALQCLPYVSAQSERSSSRADFELCIEESFVSHSLGRAAFLAAAHGTRHSLGRAAFFAAALQCLPSSSAATSRCQGPLSGVTWPRSFAVTTADAGAARAKRHAGGVPCLAATRRKPQAHRR